MFTREDRNEMKETVRNLRSKTGAELVVSPQGRERYTTLVWWFLQVFTVGVGMQDVITGNPSIVTLIATPIIFLGLGGTSRKIDQQYWVTLNGW